VFEALAFRRLGWSDENRWRNAALVRAAITHENWRPGGTGESPWRDDHDVRWLIGAHQNEGVEWFRREDHARLVWWRALPALLAAAASPALALADAQSWVAEELARAQATEWHFDRLLTGAVRVATPATATTATPAAAKPAPTPEPSGE
jgi:hypothetical protein